MYTDYQHFRGKGRSSVAHSQSMGPCVVKNHHNASISLSSRKITQRAGRLTKMRRGGVIANTLELAAYLRQRRTSWETVTWRTQATDLIDVALLRASACLNNGSCLGPCEKRCIGVSTSGKYVANLFCCGTDSKPTESWTSNLEKIALLLGEALAAAGSVNA